MNEKMITEERNTSLTRKSNFEKCKKWICNHKEELIIASVCIGAGIGTTALLCKCSPQIISTITSSFSQITTKNFTSSSITVASEIAATTTAETATIMESSVAKEVTVDTFIRNLPKTWNASAEKLAEAKVLGIELAPHQTIVNGFTKMVG